MRVAALLALITWTAGAAAEPACTLRTRQSHIAVRAIDGETIALDNGATLRLAGILAPHPPPGAAPAANWPPASDAKAALERLILGKRLLLAFPGQKTDRYGRLVAHAFLGEGEGRIWVEAELAGAGHARVAPTPESRRCIAELLAAEERARKSRLGLWAEAAYAVKTAEKPEELLASELGFALVEGRVHRVSASRSSVYIEFGRRWREDFTVLIRGRDRQAIAKAGIDLALLAGRRIRVRGYIERRNGPLLRVSVPDQIELLDQVATPSP